MKKIGITTIASLGVNVILSLWLVNQYFYDQYFHSYVDAALGPVYPFIVLTAGLGGGSSLGYLLLKRRHAGDGTGGIGKAKLFKSSGPVQPTASQAKVLPTGPPPGQVSRHTAYAVPPLPRSSSSSGASRGSAPSSISAASKPASPPSPSTSQRLEQLTQPSTSVLNSTLRDQGRPEPAPRFTAPPPPTVSRGESPPPINRIPPDSSKTSFPQQWKPEPSPAPDRGFDSQVFPRPSQMEPKQSSSESSPFGSPLGQAPKPPTASQTPFPVSKWVPPDQKGETQWTDAVPKPGLAAPQKWAPPPNQGFGPRPPQGGSPQGGPPRPGAGPGPGPGPTGQRPPYPQGQAPLPPRPLGFPAPTRPGQPGPIGVPPPFRSDQPRPPGPPPQGRPMSPPGGSMPQPWSPQKTSDKPEQESRSKDFGSPSSRPPQFGSPESLRPSTDKTPEPSGSGGEMDWDTALDTILKTLKKDRGVGEKSE